MKRNEFIASFLLPLWIENPAKCTIKSSKICDGCEYNLAKKIAYQKGVKDVIINNDTDTITIIFNPKKTDEKVLEKFIISVGYDANSQKADVNKRDEIHECCIKEGHHH